MSKAMKSTEKKKRKWQSPARVVKNNWYMLRYAFRYTPTYPLVTLGEGVGRAGDHILDILFTKYLLDAIETGVDFGRLMMWLGLYLLYRICFELFNKWRLEVYVPKTKLILHEKIQNELYMKALSLDQSCYDDPGFYNDFIWAIRESDVRVAQIMENMSIFINRVISAVALLGVMTAMDSVVSLILVLTLAIGFLLKSVRSRMFFEKNEEDNPLQRRASYIDRVFYLPERAKELRQGKISGHLMNEYSEALDERTEVTKRFWHRYLPVAAFIALISRVIPGAGITAYMIIKYVSDASFSLGSFGASLNAFNKLNWILNDIGNYLNKFNEHSLYIDKVRRFVEYEPKIKGEVLDIPPFESLEIKDLDFSYPFSATASQGGEQDAETSEKAPKILDGVTLKIKRGEKIAFVGYNGAGKTTLTKLLMRLYDPSDGEILYNGENIRNFAPESYRRHIGAVFQDYKIFAATLAENVLGGEFDGSDNEHVRVERALNAASFGDKLATLENGIMSPLTKEFDKNGIGLSGGEAQKVAIARVFARPYEIIIMDEPSSALDPVAEYELNRSILENSAGHTVIFISHRLSTTRMADRIYMFESGRIIESGSHDELMASGGKYARMYITQAKKYESDKALAEAEI